jgi:hypothetical protein
MTRINVGIAPTNLPDELLLAELRGLRGKFKAAVES